MKKFVNYRDTTVYGHRSHCTTYWPSFHGEYSTCGPTRDKATVLVIIESFYSGFSVCYSVFFSGFPEKLKLSNPDHSYAVPFQEILSRGGGLLCQAAAGTVCREKSEKLEKEALENNPPSGQIDLSYGRYTI